MKRQTVGGYQGPVTIIAANGQPVARAACRYRAEVDRSGSDRWQGQLHRIIPADAMREGVYRLRFPDGEEGEVRVDEPRLGSDEVPFAGVGVRPLYPL